MNTDIVYQDHDLLILNKAAGLLSQKDKSGDEDISGYLKKLFPAAPFLAPIHRLDRNTSGLIVVAMNSNSAAKLTKDLQNGKIKRKYWAIVKGDPGEKGVIDLPLRKEHHTNEVFVDEDSGKNAITHFIRKKMMGGTSLVEIELETGRSHQIRAHFAHIKCYLVGDKKYAKKPWSDIFIRPALHAREIRLIHPTSEKQMQFTVEPPADFQKLLQSFLKGVK